MKQSKEKPDQQQSLRKAKKPVLCEKKLQVWWKVGGGRVGGPAEGGVSDITLMNQCQQSDEKIIKKQARSVLNTAKGKRPILLYWSTVRMENGNKWRQEQKSCRKKKKQIHIINDAKMPFRWHYESRQYK